MSSNNGGFREFVPKHLRPYHIRLRDYQEARRRIFNEQITTAVQVHKKVKRATKRLREFWKRVLRNRKCILSAVISDRDRFDLRPFATVRIFNENIIGMIDTGATVSCFASDYARKF